MKEDIIIFGAGHYGRKAYQRLKDVYTILCFVDNNAQNIGESLYGKPVVSIDGILDYADDKTDIVICVGLYAPIIVQLMQMNIHDYYIMVEGFLFHTSEHETMMPVELNSALPYRKRNDAKSILFVQNAACIRTHKLAAVMKTAGYNVNLIYTMSPPIDEYAEYAGLYENIWGFTSFGGIQTFIKGSEFDIIHCSNAPDILVNIVIGCDKPVVFDTHDMQSIRNHLDMDGMALEYLANVFCDGNIYTSEGVKELADEKFLLHGKNKLVFENLILNQTSVSESTHKISQYDHEIHCVYEGGVVGSDSMNHRYFEQIWMAVAAYGIHIHFYSQSDMNYCKELEKKSPYLHYEGNVGGKDLITELTKYDLGLLLFNVNRRNKDFIETGSPNKLFEYLNARIPIVVGNVDMHIAFVDKYNVGIVLDFDKDILKQLREARKIQIPKDFLLKNSLTMEAQASNLANFYENIIKQYNRS